MAHYAAATGPDGEANRHFALPIYSARCEHARKVGACHQEDQSREDQHAECESLRRATNHVTYEAGLGEFEAQAVVYAGILAGQLGGDYI